MKAWGQSLFKETVICMPISQFAIIQATRTVSVMLDLRVNDVLIDKLESDVKIIDLVGTLKQSMNLSSLFL